MSEKTKIAKIRKSAILMVVFSALALTASGKGRQRDFPRFTFGVEGHLVQTVADFSHFNFISEEGERIDIKGLAFKYIINGQFLLNAGVNIGKNTNISLNFGYMGVDLSERIYPLTLRATWLSGQNPLASRGFVFIDGGTGFGPCTDRPAILSKLGGGYRVSLNRNCKLDFILSYQFSYIHPGSYEMIEGNPIKGSALRRNNSVVSGITAGIGLNF